MLAARYRRFPKQRNLLRNAWLTGAQVGTPGVLPRDWSLINPDASVSTQVVSVGYDSGWPLLGFRVFGTPSLTGAVKLCFVPAPPTLPNLVRGRQKDPFAFSAFVKQLAQVAAPTFVQLDLMECDVSGAVLVSNTQAITPTATQPLVRQRGRCIKRLQSSGAAFVVPNLTTGFTSGVAVDVTLGIALPQCERGDSVSAPEPRNVLL